MRLPVSGRSNRHAGAPSAIQLLMPTRGVVQERCGDDRPDPGVEEGVAQRACFRHAHADLLHQSRRTQSERVSSAGTGKSQTVAAPPRRAGTQESAGAPEGSLMPLKLTARDFFPADTMRAKKDSPIVELPDGFVYQSDFLSEAEEGQLLREIATLSFQRFEFQGYVAKRRIVEYGWEYDFGSRRAAETEAIPDYLFPVR